METKDYPNFCGTRRLHNISWVSLSIFASVCALEFTFKDLRFGTLVLFITGLIVVLDFFYLAWIHPYILKCPECGGRTRTKKHRYESLKYVAKCDTCRVYWNLGYLREDPNYQNFHDI